MAKTESIYKDRKSTEEETGFQKAFEYFFDMSMHVIGNNVGGKSILDVGAGGDEKLGLELEKNGARYTAFDKDEGFLQKLRESNLSIVKGDILLHPFGPKSYDIVHTRCLLMHISGERLPMAIKNILSLARERAIFLELDWKTFQSGGPVTKAFQDFSLELISEFGDPFIGSKLLHSINEVSCKIDRVKDVLDNRFPRKAGAYYYEIIPLVKMMTKVMEQLQHKLLECGKDILELITTESKKAEPEKFVPPDVVYVEVIF